MIKNLSDDERFHDVEKRIILIREEIAKAAQKSGRNPDEITLMAVTKTVPAEVVNRAIDQGIGVLGENRCQEFLEKYADYKPADVQFIGHLQTNKVKYIIDKVSMIQSVDSLKLAQEISKQSRKIQKVMDILLEVNIGREESKSGIYPEQLEELVEQVALLPAVHIRGLMAIPPVSNTDSEKSRYFESMYKLLVDIASKKIDNVSMDTLSMGMSSDYSIAIAHGSTMVRLGSAIFGARTYKEDKKYER